MNWLSVSTLQLLLLSSVCLFQAQIAEGQHKGRNNYSPAPKFGDRIKPFVRGAKSLRQTFPFNANNNHANHDHAHHHHASNPSQTQYNDNRGSRQGQGNGIALDIGTIAAAGERCIDKVVTVEETEYDNVINCKHSYSERCHTTYKTDYTPQQEEECDENFRKNCFIDYKNVAIKEKVKVCFQPLVRNCNIPGPIECTTEYQTRCTTRYHEHQVEDDVPNCVEEQEFKCKQVTRGYTTEEECKAWPVKKCNLQRERVNKYTPETHCEKVPYELCGPSACPVEPGPEQCQEKEETIIQESPEEICTLEPQTECKHVTKLVPKLEPSENCVDVPKEICVRQRNNPRKVSKPIVKKWCYTPTAESGLLPESQFTNGNNNQGSRPPTNVTPQRPQGCLQGRPVDYCPSRSGNGRCDRECNTPACGYDGGDCNAPVTTPAPQGCLRGRPYDYCPSRANNGRCDRECNTPACGYDGGDCNAPVTTPAPQGCLRGRPYDYCPSRANNGRCDRECNTPACGYDGGDCNAPVTTPAPQGCLRGRPYDYCPNRSSNGRCDQECNTAACGYDGGDCLVSTLRPQPPPTAAPQGCLRGRQVDYCPRRANNGRCDSECNTSACGYDGGDCEVVAQPQRQGCIPGKPVDYCERRSNNGRCDYECNNQACGYDNGECNQRPSPPQRPQRPQRPQSPPQRGCLNGYQANYCESRRNNGRCEPECNIPACNYDGNDCNQPPPRPPHNGYLPPPPGGYGK